MNASGRDERDIWRATLMGRTFSVEVAVGSLNPQFATSMLEQLTLVISATYPVDLGKISHT